MLQKAHSPLHSVEHALGPYVAFPIMPTFAFFKAGVAVGGGEARIGVLSAWVAAALIGLAFLRSSLPKVAESAERQAGAD